MEVKLQFDEVMLDYLREKFEIKTEEDLIDAIMKMVNTYMEM